MSDTVIISLIGGVVTLIGTCFTALMAYLVAKINKVRTDLERSNEVNSKKMDDLKVVTDTTHSLVNSAAIKMAKLYAVSARLNAHLTKDAGYVRIAEEAEKALAVMEATQDRVDAKIDSDKRSS